MDLVLAGRLGASEELECGEVALGHRQEQEQVANRSDFGVPEFEACEQKQVELGLRFWSVQKVLPLESKSEFAKVTAGEQKKSQHGQCRRNHQISHGIGV